MHAEHESTNASPQPPSRPADPAETAAALARQAVSLVVGGCATTVAMRALRELAGDAARPALEAARRVEHAEELDLRVRRAAVALLRWAAVGAVSSEHRSSASVQPAPPSQPLR